MTTRLHMASIMAAIVLQVSAQSAPKAMMASAAMSKSPLSETALFAGGCFWSLESAFEKVYGVIDAVSGYTGGRNSKPSYEDYAENGHVEAVQVVFDPSRVSYAELLDAYFHHSDPSDPNGAFVDRGPQYRPIVFYQSEAQRKSALAAEAALSESRVFGKPIVATVSPAPRFWPAEDYHQDYARKNPAAYERYRANSGRDQFFARAWGKAALAEPGLPPHSTKGRFEKPSKAELRKRLTPTQFEVTQEDGTEPAFQNEFWDDHREGIFVDIVSGEALFSSRDKYDSGTGWPSFTRPLVPSNVVVRMDATLGMERNEVRSRYADSHLGHVFDDGPAPTGLRYCMDSAALRFVPLADLEKEGYGAFLKYFRR